MKTPLTLIGLVISFQLHGADFTTGGNAIIWGYAWDSNEMQCLTNLVAISKQPLNNTMPCWIEPSGSVGLIKSDGAVIFSGKKNVWTDVPTGLSNITAVAIGSRFGLALLKNASISIWGDSQYGKTTVPESATNVVAIATGDETCVVVRQDGTVIGWGKNKIPDGLSNVTAVAMSTLQSGRNLALKRDGTVVEFRNYAPFSLHSVVGLTNVVRIAVGPAHNLALKSDGTVFAWGHCLYGETNLPVGLSDVVAIAVGGYRNEGMAGFGYSLALKNDGTITAWGVMGFNNQPVIVPEGLSNVVSIAAGGNSCLAITTNSAVAESFKRTP